MNEREKILRFNNFNSVNSKAYNLYLATFYQGELITKASIIRRRMKINLQVQNKVVVQPIDKCTSLHAGVVQPQFHLIMLLASV